MYNIETKQFLVVDGYHRVVQQIRKNKKTIPIKIWSSSYSDYYANIPDEDLVSESKTKNVFGLGTVDPNGVVYFKKFPPEDLPKLTHMSSHLPIHKDRFRYDDGWVEWTDRPTRESKIAVENYLFKNHLPFEKHSSYWGNEDYENDDAEDLYNFREDESIKKSDLKKLLKEIVSIILNESGMNGEWWFQDGQAFR